MHNILIAGVSPEWLRTAAASGYDTGERNESAKIAASAQRMMADLKSYKKTAFEGHCLNPDDPADWKKFVATVKSKQWDCITFGQGVRTIPELGYYFTDLIHLAMTEQDSLQAMVGEMLRFVASALGVGEAQSIATAVESGVADTPIRFLAARRTSAMC